MAELGRGGDNATRLVILRGNSGAGKSTVARALRARAGRRIALVEQDYLRRTVLRERVSEGTLHIHLIDQVARLALDGGYDVLLEGIFFSRHYRSMLDGLRRDHRGATHAYYLDVSLEGSLDRHAARPQANEFSADDMRGWYIPADALGWDDERRVPEASPLVDTVEMILRETALDRRHEREAGDGESRLRVR